MKLIIKIIMLLVISLNGFTQNNTVCIYKVKTNESDLIDNENDTNKVVNIMMNNAFKAIDKLEYILIYNEYESLFLYKDRIEIEDEENERYIKLAELMTSSGIYYQNKKDDIVLKQIEVYGEDFLITELLKNNWKITNVKKQIGEYTCYLVKNVNSSCGSSNIELWFTPQISVPFGPKGMGGLPGLIVEMKMNKVTIYLDKILRNQDNKIERPSKGKLVTLDEFNRIMEEMRNGYRK